MKDTGLCSAKGCLNYGVWVNKTLDICLCDNCLEMSGLDPSNFTKSR